MCLCEIYVEAACSYVYDMHIMKVKNVAHDGKRK